MVILHFAYASLLTAITSICVGILVYFKNPRGPVNYRWGLLSIANAVWSFGVFVAHSTEVEATMLFWSRIHDAAAILIAVFFLHFIYTFLDLQDSKKRRILFICYIVASFLLFFSPTDLFINKVGPRGVFKFYVYPGVLYHIFTVYFALTIGYSHWLLIREYYRSKGHRKVQIQYVFIAALIGFTGGLIDFLPVYKIPIYPFGNYAIFVYPLIITYAILKYRLMQVEIIIKKTMIFTGIFAFAFAVFASVAFLAQEFLVTLWGDNTRYAILVFSVFFITIGIRPLERLLVRATDKVLFQKKYDYQQTLKEASEGMTLVTDMKKLLNLVVRIVSKNIRVKNAAIFQLDEAKDKYVLKIRRGTNRKHIGYSLGKDDVMVSWLKSHKETLLYDEVEDWLKSSRFLRREKGLKDKLIAIKEELVSMDGVICVPSFSKGKLIGFLILGEKLSGDIYTQEDVRLLSTLASEAAIAVENAKNFTELEKLREKERESYIQTVMALAQTVDEKDSYTHGHLEDVGYYGMQVAEELQESSEFKGVINKEDLKIALSLHDIGKIGVPDAILHKNGKLTPEEWVIMKQHCEIGARIVEPIEKLRNVGNIIKHHQEKYDGTGYPDGLKGEEIPLESRIIAVVDSYHAMVSDRPYRKALSEEVALQELKNNIGTQFDPVVLGAFVRAWEKGKIKKL